MELYLHFPHACIVCTGTSLPILSHYVYPPESQKFLFAVHQFPFSLYLSLSFPLPFLCPLVAPCPLSHSHFLMWVQPVYCIMFLFIHLNVPPLLSKFLYCISYMYSICEWILFGKEICYRSLFFWRYAFVPSHWFSFSFFLGCLLISSGHINHLFWIMQWNLCFWPATWGTCLSDNLKLLQLMYYF